MVAPSCVIVIAEYRSLCIRSSFPLYILGCARVTIILEASSNLGTVDYVLFIRDRLEGSGIVSLGARSRAGGQFADRSSTIPNHPQVQVVTQRFSLKPYGQTRKFDECVLQMLYSDS